MQSLPNELWCQIFSYLPSKDKSFAKLVCKLWHDLIINDTQHIIFNLMDRYPDSDKFEWNYKRILNIVRARPNLDICQFESYMNCQYIGDGFATFFKQAKLLSVNKITLDGNLSHFCSDFLPGWITVQKLWLQDSLQVDETNIQEIVAYVPGCRLDESEDESISDKFMQELEEILPKLKHLEELSINFEACDVPFTLITLFELLYSLPIQHLKEVEFKNGQLLDVTEEEFKEFVISALKEKLWPDCELNLKDFEFRPNE